MRVFRGQPHHSRAIKMDTRYGRCAINYGLHSNSFRRCSKTFLAIFDQKSRATFRCRVPKPYHKPLRLKQVRSALHSSKDCSDVWVGSVLLCQSARPMTPHLLHMQHPHMHHPQIGTCNHTNLQEQMNRMRNLSTPLMSLTAHVCPEQLLPLFMMYPRHDHQTPMQIFVWPRLSVACCRIFVLRRPHQKHLSIRATSKTGKCSAL